MKMVTIKRKCVVNMYPCTNQENPVLFLGNDRILDMEFRRIPSTMMHLYIIIDDKNFSTSDWVLENDVLCLFNSKRDVTKCKKVIATTYPNTDLPKPSKEFIAKYCDMFTNEKPITHVLVEFESSNNRDFIIKVNPKNEIIIHKVKNEFSSKEVKSLFAKFRKDFALYRCMQILDNEMEVWFENNLN